jgi:hypothetical protein
MEVCEMEIKTTQEYFNLSVDELSQIKNEYGYTKEDCLMFDDGIAVRFYDTLESLEDGKQYHVNENPRIDVKTTLKTTDNRYALILI